MSFTPAQCRAARGLLGWSQTQLAEASKVATKTIADFERESRTPYDRTLADIERAFEAAGVEFTNGGQPGVRSRKEFKAGDVAKAMGVDIAARISVSKNPAGNFIATTDVKTPNKRK
jgi:transcriptional regulator with XRE-family HTH domain